MWIWIWLGIIIIAVIIEVFTVGLTSIWLAGGALVAMLASFLHAPVWLQISLFFAVTFLLIFFTRPWAVKAIESKTIRTNYESIPGKEVRVIEQVNNHMETGKVLYNGMEWSARSLNEDEVFEKDEFAKVAAVEGVKLLIIRDSD